MTKLLQAPFVGRREKKQVARTSRELLALHHTVAAQYPASKGRALYRRIVAARRGIELSEADAILRRANDSFAKWPVERPLIFRDVVHYLALSDYLASNDSANWARENLGREVARFIPEDL